MVSTVPNRTNRVNDPSRFRRETGRDASLARRTWRLRAACCIELRTSRAKNCAAHPAASQQTLVRRIDDRVDVESRDISVYDRDPLHYDDSS